MHVRKSETKTTLSDLKTNTYIKTWSLKVTFGNEIVSQPGLNLPEQLDCWTGENLLKTAVKILPPCRHEKTPARHWLKVKFTNRWINKRLDLVIFQQFSIVEGWTLPCQQGYKIMIKANSSTISTNTEALLGRESPYLKYRTEPLIIDVDLHKRQRVHCWIWFTGRDSVCRRVSTFHWILKTSIHSFWTVR